MAKNTDANMIEATALVNLKYDNDVKAIGEKLSVRQADVEDLIQRGYIKAEINAKVDADKAEA